MFERITEAEINERSMANVSTTPGRRTAFGEGGLDAKALKLRFDRLGRYLAKRLNEVFDGIADGSLAEVLYIDSEGKKRSLKDFVDSLLTGQVESIKIQTSDGVITLTELGDRTQEMYNGLDTGDLAGKIKIIEGVTLKKFYEDFLKLEDNISTVKSVNGKTGEVKLSAEDVKARPDTWMPTAQQVGADPSGSASNAVSVHNVQTNAHNDIRLELQRLAGIIADLLDSDDATLDEMHEIVAYIKSNKALIEAITTSKVNVADIIDNLDTNVSDKPLSAAQGVALKLLIDDVAAEAGKDVYILSESETLDDVPDDISVVIDPNGNVEIDTVTSWNDLTDKPFDEFPPAFDITWDGDMTGRETLTSEENAYLVKVSDEVYTKEQLLNSTLYGSDGSDYTLTEEDIYIHDEVGLIDLGDVCVIFSAETFANATGLPEGSVSNGVWFWNWTGEALYYVKRFVASSTIKKLDNKYLDLEDYAKTEDLEGYAKTEDLSAVAKSGSWNDLKDKPFGSEFEYTELASATGVVNSYNADTLRASFQATLDFVPISQKLYTLVATDGVRTLEAVQTYTIMDFPAMNYYSGNIGVHITDALPIMLSQGVKGSAWNVHFIATTEVGAEWTITVYEQSEIITPLDGKYLSDGVPFVASASVGQGIAVKAVDGNKPTEFEAVNLVKSYNDLTDVPVKEIITTLMSEQTVSFSNTSAVQIGTRNIAGCNLVSFDGEKYKVQESGSSLTRYYGNLYLEGTWKPDNGLPFLLKHDLMLNSLYLYAKTVGTHTISAYKQELTFLSGKFLPDSVVLESELTAKGYQTEAQVITLINNALGVIENGTY